MRHFWPESELTLTVAELCSQLSQLDSSLPVVLTWEGQVIELGKEDITVVKPAVQDSVLCVCLDADNCKYHD